MPERSPVALTLIQFLESPADGLLGRLLHGHIKGDEDLKAILIERIPPVLFLDIPANMFGKVRGHLQEFAPPGVNLQNGFQSLHCLRTANIAIFDHLLQDVGLTHFGPSGMIIGGVSRGCLREAGEHCGLCEI